MVADHPMKLITLVFDSNTLLASPVIESPGAELSILIVAAFVTFGVVLLKFQSPEI